MWNPKRQSPDIFWDQNIHNKVMVTSSGGPIHVWDPHVWQFYWISRLSSGRNSNISQPLYSFHLKCKISKWNILGDSKQKATSRASQKISRYLVISTLPSVGHKERQNGKHNIKSCCSNKAYSSSWNMNKRIEGILLELYNHIKFSRNTFRKDYKNYLFQLEK